jgi:hypothetical protein
MAVFIWNIIFGACNFLGCVPDPIDFFPDPSPVSSLEICSACLSCYFSVSDLDPRGSALISVGWIRIRNGNAGSRRAKMKEIGKEISSFDLLDVNF